MKSRNKNRHIKNKVKNRKYVVFLEDFVDLVCVCVCVRVCVCVCVCVYVCAHTTHTPDICLIASAGTHICIPRNAFYDLNSFDYLSYNNA